MAGLSTTTEAELIDALRVALAAIGNLRAFMATQTIVVDGRKFVPAAKFAVERRLESTLTKATNTKGKP